MREIGAREVVRFPEDVEFSLEDINLEVSGPNGELSRTFDMKGINLEAEDDSIVIESVRDRKKQEAMVGTVASHIRNMIKGVTEGFTSKLKVVHSHFPITVSLEGGCVKIENFIGGEKPRYAEIVGETEVDIQGDEIVLNGNDKDDVGQTAANIEQIAQVKDRDPRVFQDGIFIVERP